jgi:hypothetical protein
LVEERETFFFSNWSLLCLICQKISREEKLKEREPNCKTRRNTMANVKLGGQSSFSSSYFSFSNFIVPIIFVISNLTKKIYFFYILVSINERGEKKLLDSRWRQNNWLTPILALKIIDLGVNEFHSMEGVWWWLF